MSVTSEYFYQQWSAKATDEITYDLESSVRKAEVIIKVLEKAKDLGLKTVVDFGCGYGKIIHVLRERLNLHRGYGFDFSEAAIEYANKHFADESIQFHRLLTLDILQEREGIQATLGGVADCVLLVDVLEHVPDCLTLISELSQVTKYFFIKLPIEQNILFNYVLKKEYPSSVHSNGHLREFTVNDVHYFIRKLGLTPLIEGTYVYVPCDAFPPLPSHCDFRGRIKRLIIKWFSFFCSRALPKRIHLRLVGMGSYYCLATFDKAHVLYP